VTSLSKNGTYQEWFLEKVSPEPTSGCWLWTGGYHSERRAGKKQRLRKPYGKYSIGEKTLTAHRASYILFVGDIPSGMFVCHRCDNPSCVNPGHLFIGTPSENSADMKAKGRSYKPALGEKARVLSVRDVLEIKNRVSRGEGQQKIADRFGISQTMVSRIKLGKVWGRA
jgi:hypothetical protein